MKKKYLEGLSIVIPSYNRRNELVRLLQSIQGEDLSMIYEIVIVDNNSEYDIYKELEPFLFEKVRIVRNTFNIQMGTNMMSTFLYCNTKWMWLISDDDLICRDSFKIILEKIAQNKDAALLKFSTEGIGDVGKEGNTKVRCLEEFIDYYHKDKIIRRGNLILISNGVYNLENLYPFLGTGFEYSYTFIPFLIPVFFALNNNIPVVFFEDKIVKYSHPSSGPWSFNKVCLGMSTLSHVPLILDQAYLKKLFNITMIISYRSLFLYFVKTPTSDSRNNFNLIYSNIYRLYLKPWDKIIFKFFSFLLLFPKTLKQLFDFYKNKK